VLAGLLAPPGASANEAEPAPAAVGVFEAEDGTLQGVTVGSSASGYSGTGYVEGFDEDGDRVDITIPDSPGGLYELTVHYRGPYGQKNAQLQLNGAGLGEVTLPETTEFSTVPAGKILLEEGDNTVSVLNGWGWYELDAIALAPVAPRPPHRVSGEPVDPDATEEARELLRLLTDHYGEVILSGQQGMASIEWLEDTIGRAPAVAGLDMMDYSPSRVERGTSSQEVENALAWDARGGISTFVWHWNAPSGLIDEPGREWWRGFYTDATTFDVEAALADTGSEDYRLLVRDIDAIAAELLRLQDAGVPVLWRPLHEAEGGWFWWGAKGAEPAKELWRLMYDRMVGHHGLHNLLWVWNSVSPDWYPGDDVVDIVSADSYPPRGDYGPVSATYEKLVELGRDRKLVALTEVGPIPDPDLLEAYEADWSWFVTWEGDFITDGEWNSRGHLEHVYHHERVITLDELDELRDGGKGGCTVGYRVDGDWGSGFLGSIEITNLGDPVESWELGFAFPAGQSVAHGWNGSWSRTGDRVTVSDAGWNGRLGTGESAVIGFIGFIGGYSGANPAPQDFTLNGAACAAATS
jgi:mannan endo-1,4-beta-mannosidase